jgi:anaerobic selenocysteine-containing dehydrogenase
VHYSYGHHYVTLNRPSIEPVGECKPNSEIYRLLAARMGIDHPVMLDDDLELIRQALDSESDKFTGVTLETLLEKGWTRLNVPRPYLPFAEGSFPTPSGKCELYSQRLADMGLDPIPTFTPPYESVESSPELAARFPLSLISSPAQQFLHSAFVNVDALRRGAHEPELVIHPDDAMPRAVLNGTRVEVRNDRGSFSAVARVSDAVSECTVWAPPIWWTKFS